MKSIKGGLAALLAVVLLMSSMPISAFATEVSEPAVSLEETSKVTVEENNQETLENVEDKRGDTTKEPIVPEELPEIEESTVPEEPTAPEEPPVSEEPTAPEEPLVSEEPTAPPVSEEPTAPEEPPVSDEAAIPEKAEPTGEVVESDLPKESADSAEIAQDRKESQEDEVLFNTGSDTFCVVSKKAFENGTGDDFFEEDGSYVIQIPEENPFFPYEVQFTYCGETYEKWFHSPKDSVEIGGHLFYVSASFDNTVVTQMNFNVAGNEVVVYPEKKEFIDKGEVEERSLLPLEEKSFRVDLTGYTPAELTMVSVDKIFTGEHEITDKSKLAWTYYGDDNYSVSQTGDLLDLSLGSYYGGRTWEMILGTGDQLDSNGIRYMIHVDVTESENWLIPTVCSQDAAGNRTNFSVAGSHYQDYRKDRREFFIQASGETLDSLRSAYVSFRIDKDTFENAGYVSYKAYEGKYETAAEALSGTDITQVLCNSDMTQKDAGYLLDVYKEQWVTIVTFDSANRVTGCLPMKLYLTTVSNGARVDRFYQKTETDWKSVNDGYTYTTQDGCRMITMRLSEGYPANGQYYLNMEYVHEGIEDSSKITGAYIGKYSSISEAENAGAKDIKELLFAENPLDGGYQADYSQGVYFTIFVGSDGTESQKVLEYCIRTKETEEKKNEVSLNRGADVWFTSFIDGNGATIDAYMADSLEDSYAEYKYLTVFVGSDADLTNLAPVFTTSKGMNLYTTGSSSPEISGKSYHDFSKGPLQFSTASEDGTNSKNYWVQVIKAKEGVGQLYINSLADANAETREEGGVIYSTREIVLDSYHDNIHDILLANIGTEVISGLSAELVSDTVVLDEYWTLKGVYGLSGLTTVNKMKPNGELPNLAKIRLKAKEGVKSEEVSGTLTIKSDNKPLMVLKLTGLIGDPSIVTKEIPNSVLYVPYGTMIQNNNKYSWNEISYTLQSGSLPDGMVLRRNGEVYGVPKKSGSYTFTVRMESSYHSFKTDAKTFTLVVMDHTDANVEASTDTGYDLSQRVQNISIDATGNQLLVSEGQYTEFVDVWLDGVKLAKGTDYESESGSTRITIRNQTLLNAQSTDGIHTLGIEFRTKDTDVLKRAAQNYRIIGTGDTGNQGTDNDRPSEDANQGNSSNNGSSGSSSSGNIDAPGQNAVTGNTAIAVDGPAVITYTVEVGDSLWKIAEKFFGSGEAWKRIFDANKNLIKDPNRIYVGQQLKIYITEGKLIDSAQGDLYVVQTGDSLWKISRKVYGAGWFWKKVYNANKDKISDPNILYTGQVLSVP